MNLRRRLERLEDQVRSSIDRPSGRIVIYDPEEGPPEVQPSEDVVIYLPDNKRGRR